MSEGLSVCKALAAMFHASDEVNEAAINFVAMTALQVGLNEEENKAVQDILKTGDDYDALLSGIESKAMRGLFLQRMLAAVLMDEKISEKEQELIDRTLDAFSITRQKGAELVAWTKIGLEVSERLSSLLRDI